MQNETTCQDGEAPKIEGQNPGREQHARGEKQLTGHAPGLKRQGEAKS